MSFKLLDNVVITRGRLRGRKGFVHTITHGTKGSNWNQTIYSIRLKDGSLIDCGMDIIKKIKTEEPIEAEKVIFT